MTSHISKYLLVLMIAAAPTVHGSGFAIQERSIKGLGRAFSGEAALADDASVIASNAAGMSYLSRYSYSVGASVIDGHFEVRGRSFVGGPPGVELYESDTAPTAVVPSIYFSSKVGDRLSYGVGVFANFGLKSVYPSSFAGFAIAQKSELKTINVNPSVAYQVSDNWSLGAGVSLLRAEAELTGQLAATGGRILLEGDDFGFGYNFGVIYDNREGARVGLSYRSSIAVKLQGDGMNTVDRVVPLGPVEAAAKLPGMIELSVYQELNDQWAVHGDVLYTRWNSFQHLTAFTTSGVEVLNNAERWENSYKFALGATYKVSEDLTIRGGVAYDQTPVPSRDFRTLRIPDADRIWLSLGATYKLSDAYEIDFGYTYVKAVTSSINEPGAGNGLFVGEASGHSHLFGVGMSGVF